MSSMKIHVIKGVNRYSDDLIKNESQNLNRRREANFNVNHLNEHERSSSRARSFAVYKPLSKSKRNQKLEPASKDEGDTDDSEKFHGTDYSEKSSDGMFNQEESSEDVDESGDLDDYNANDGDRVTSGGKKSDKSDHLGFNDVFKLNKVESNDNDDYGIGDYNFSSNVDAEDSTSVKSSGGKESNNVFKKLTDRIKEKYEQSSFKELHERNMENMRRQFKSVIWKKSSSEDYSDDGTNSGGSDYWESKGDTNFDKADFTPKPFGLGANRVHPKVLNYESDDGKKRCCC